MPSNYWVVRQIHAWFVAYVIIFGISIIASGPARLSGASFAGLREVTGWAHIEIHWGMGGTFLLLGVLAAIKSTRLLGMALITLTLMLQTVGFMAAMKVSPMSAVTPVVTYGFVALLAAWLCAWDWDEWCASRASQRT